MKQLSFAVAMLLCTAVSAQERNSVTGGLLVGANFYDFLVSDNVPDDYNFKLSGGYDAGGWVNVPFGKVLSVEAQPMFSSRKFKPEDKSNQLNQPNVKMGFFSLPVLLKGNLGRNFALFAGPQFDFRTNFSDESYNARKQEFDDFNLSLTGGIEVFPNNTVTFYARYAYGFNDMYIADDDLDNNIELNQSGIHVGLKFRLLGGPVVAASVAAAAAVAPSQDSDGDGFIDIYDECPNVYGIAKYTGCPAPDTDGDGVNDDDDRCPELPGSAENRGCLEMVYYFSNAESTLTNDDKANLNSAADFLNRYPNLIAIVEGHTSTDGEADFNQRLSEQRAQSSVDYLVSKGISRSRISAKGFGEQFPIGDNNTPEGKAKSRRVVVRIQ